MKSKTLLLNGMLFCAMWNLTAQNFDIPDLLSRLDQNHATSITSVFSTSEMEALRIHFDAHNLSETTQPNPELVSEIFAPENTNGSFGHFSSSTPSNYNVVAPSGAAEFEGAGAYDPYTGLYYVIDNNGNSYAVDPSTGDYAPLPNVTAPNGENFTGLEFDPQTGDLFAISTNGTGSSSISTIDPATGEVTFIGQTDLVLAIACAFEAAGAYLYAYDLDVDLMYRVNKFNAEVTLLGPLGFDANFGQGMILAAAGQIYLTAFNNDTFRSELRMLNENTGATSLISPIGDATFPGQTLQFAWSSIYESTLNTADRALISFALYPNPAAELLEVSHIDTLEHITITTVLGQIVLDIKVDATVSAIDVSQLATGNYVVFMTTAKGTATRQLIKK